MESYDRWLSLCYHSTITPVVCKAQLKHKLGLPYLSLLAIVFLANNCINNIVWVEIKFATYSPGFFINFHRLGPLGRVGHRVAMSVCMYVCVCMSVIKVLIVDNGQSIMFFVFFHETEWVNMVLRILNLEWHQNCMIGSKVATIWTMFFIHD